MNSLVSCLVRPHQTTSARGAQSVQTTAHSCVFTLSLSKHCLVSVSLLYHATTKTTTLSSETVVELQRVIKVDQETRCWWRNWCGLHKTGLLLTLWQTSWNTKPTLVKLLHNPPLRLWLGVFLTSTSNNMAALTSRVYFLAQCNIEIEWTNECCTEQ